MMERIRIFYARHRERWLVAWLLWLMVMELGLIYGLDVWMSGLRCFITIITSRPPSSWRCCRC